MPMTGILLRRIRQWAFVIVCLGEMGRVATSAEYKCHKEFNIDLHDQRSVDRVIDYLQNQTDKIASIDTTLIRVDEFTTIAPADVDTGVKTYCNWTTSLPQTTPCDSSRFKFKSTDHLHYIRYNGSVPRMTSFSACAWIQPQNRTNSSLAIISYCVSGTENCNTFVVWLIRKKIRVTFNSSDWKLKNIYSEISDKNTEHRTHICIVNENTSMSLYINASKKDFESLVPATLEALEGGGVSILGQNLDGGMDGSDPTPIHYNQGFRGEIEGFQLWNRSLDSGEIERMYKSGGCKCPLGVIINFNQSNSIVEGNVTYNWKITGH